MKKLNLLIFFCLLTRIVSAQNQQFGTSLFNMAAYYGTNTKLGMDIIYGKKIVGGIGVATHLGKGAVGKDYSETMGPNAFADDIYEVIEADDIAIYGIIGSRVTSQLMIAAKLGVGTRTKYYNGYDEFQILSPNGYWYTSTDAGTKVLIGAFAQYQIGKWSPYLGADTFSGINIGIGYNF